MIITSENRAKRLKEILMEDMNEKVKAAPKYKVGDRVKYYDVHNVKRRGFIIEVSETDVYEWNKDKEQKYVYLLSSSDYLRYEEDIIELCYK